MSDAKSLARLLVLQAAILAVLKEADAETRDQARQIFESGDATAVHGKQGQLGRVRRDSPRVSWRIVNWSAFDASIREGFPEAWQPSVAKWARDEITRTGVLVRKATGEIFEPDGIGLVEAEGNLVVTTSDEAEDMARALIREQLKALES